MATWIAAIATLLALVSLAYTWKLQQEMNTATRRLDRYNKAIFDTQDELRRLREELSETTVQLRVAIQQNAGRAQFAPGTTIREAQLLHPQAQQMMAGLHLGGCSSCAVEPDQTLAAACADNGVDLNTMLQNLNLLLTTPNGHPNGTAPVVKLPNVELNF
jgi:hypothetical protein